MACAQPTEVLSPELIYGVRLVTLLAKATKVLRAEFHKHFTTDPAKLYLEIKQKHGQKLKLLLKQKVIHKREYYILLPASGKTNSSKFDLSLLIFALITICPIQAPVTGWNDLPFPTDRSNGANFIRLRNDRNEILHTYFEFEEKRFTSIWDRIVLALEGLGCDKQELLALKSASLDPSLKVIYEKNIQDLKQASKRISDLEDSLNGVSYNLYSPMPSFTGRETEIIKVHQNLITKDKERIAMVLHGLGGVGKSELVRQYCNRFAVSYYKGNVIWINGEDTNTMTEDFYNVAERISLNTKDESGKLLSIKSIVNKVYRFFADRPVLFVFDNVTNKASLMEFMETNTSKNVSILITSQFTDWSERFIQFRIDVLSQNDAFALVSQNVDKKYTLSDNRIRQLCEKMQYLPLALQQSIAYIKIWSITIDEYLDEFQYYADEILETNQSDEMYDKTVKTTWNMALHKLENSKLAITLINIMSLLDGNNIKKGLFNECYGEKHKVRKALQLLQQYSLIFITTIHDDLEQTILMHSLVQYVIRTESKQTYLQQFLDIIFHPLDDDCNIEHESYGKYWYYQLAYMFYQKPNCNILAAKISKHLPHLETIFSSKGKYTMYFKVLILLETFQKGTFGYKDQKTLKTCSAIAKCFQDIGNYKEALDKYQEVEKLQTKTIGYKHPDTLETKHGIADCLRQSGNYDAALSKYRELVKLLIATIGYKHPNMLTTQNGIAQCLQRKGKYDEALTKYQEVEKLQTETRGYEHPVTLATQHKIAQCLQHKGNYDEALTKYQEVEKLQIETFGYKHPITLITMHGIAQCLTLKENHDEALIKFQEVEQLEIETIGYKHPITLITKHDIAECLNEKGNHDEALIIYQEVEKLQIETIGYKHPSTLATKHNIAQCLSDKGNHDEALIIYQEVEKLQIETIGYKHPSTLKTKDSIAHCLFQKGNYDESLTKYQESAKLSIETIGYKHPETIKTQYNIAQCLQQNGNYDEALTKYQEVEKLQTEIRGYKHPNTLRTQHNIARCLQQEGKYDEALTKYQEVEKLQTETRGYKHPSTLVTQHNIAQCLEQKGNYDEALTKYREVEKLQIETIGYKDPSTLVTQYNIAQCLEQKGNYDEALTKYQEVVKLQTETIGYKDPNTLRTQYNIAQCLQQKGNYGEALTKYQEFKKLEIESFGYEHPSTLATERNIILCLFFIWEKIMKR